VLQLRNSLQTKLFTLQKLQRLVGVLLKDIISSSTTKQALLATNHAVAILKELFHDSWSQIVVSAYESAFGSLDVSKEKCDICEEQIPFDNLQTATCKAGHGFGTYPLTQQNMN